MNWDIDRILYHFFSLIFEVILNSAVLDNFLKIIFYQIVQLC